MFASNFVETKRKKHYYEPDHKTVNTHDYKNILLKNENHSIARLWNEILLEAIRNDYARPTVHARNLFHVSVAMYDAWAVFDENAHPYFLGNTIHGRHIPFEDFVNNNQTIEDQKKAISYAAYRLLSHRFKNSPNAEVTLNSFNLLMNQLNYDQDFTSTDYKNGNAACIGNYIAQQIIEYGLTDGSNEQNNYINNYYQPANNTLMLSNGQPQSTNKLKDPNRWQPLGFNNFIDQSGNVANSTPDFLSPEWGNVLPFSLSENDKTIKERDGYTYKVYHLPETPPNLDTISNSPESELYKWNFTLVALWGAQLDPYNTEMIDISPVNIGNIDFDKLPTSQKDFIHFYKNTNSGDISTGHSINPITKEPYKEQWVSKGDYTRVLAEFWADGPDSETPPGHWFTILNYVNDHPLNLKRFNGNGESLDNLEWDIKSYFILGGAMHDVAITAWSIKGWVDYIRPISAIRNMAKLGQSTFKELDNYHPGGIPLIDDFIEIIEEDDELSGFNNVNVGKIKIKSWKGHPYINDTKTDVAGVGWILAKNWWPYQKPTFVTPPFAGFVSGHSTFSRAAAEILTLITGTPYFPGGMGEFKAEKDNFLVFEKGPSTDITLQWATYRDASDQTSLSRIWGGIHPPADDIPGRIIGKNIGINAYHFSLPYFNPERITTDDISISPNPIKNNNIIVYNTQSTDIFYVLNAQGQQQKTIKISFNFENNSTTLAVPENLTSGIYYVKVNHKSKPIIVTY
ncbi:DUF6851 domain-containing protein [Wenyingzhuangia sp. 2_MG-2023]|nr:T9SS type A sorting domain-containing protein [Wenyingzhuangia sp. 2_MG-2023]MDO6738592.1 T9SS type A sorting domain-containing protein [Wenyingzhuangia sp. 2_MG-2023]